MPERGSVHNMDYILNGGVTHNTEIMSEWGSDSNTEIMSEWNSDSNTEIMSEWNSDSNTEIMSECDSDSNKEIMSECDSDSNTEITGFLILNVLGCKNFYGRCKITLLEIYELECSHGIFFSGAAQINRGCCINILIRFHLTITPRLHYNTAYRCTKQTRPYTPGT